VLRIKARTMPDSIPAPGPSPAPDDLHDFGAVVNAHWSAVYRLLYSLTGNAHDTEDLTQETFLRALRRRDSFQPGSRLRAWLLRIASNAFFDQRRSRKRAKTQPLVDELPGPATSPEHRLETQEQAALLQIALTELSDLTRLVFHLRVQEDLSFREIAELAGTTEQAARWHMHQARSRLVKQLNDE
jgi:RNA polymerase sigma-70 factor (ECF subfamily)